MLVRLHVIRGKANKEQVTITLPAVIGRSREADLTVIHPMISRRHCELFEDRGLVRIRDLGSLNGTYVAGEQIQETSLPPGAVFSLGPLTFRVDYDTSPDALSHEPSVVQPGGQVSPPSDIVVSDEFGPEVRSAMAEHHGGPPPAEPATEPQPWVEEASAPRFPTEMLNQSEPPPVIAPPDGALPNLNGWQPGPESLGKPTQESPASLPSGSVETSPAVEGQSGKPAWADRPPPFTTVIAKDDNRPVAPILIDSDEGTRLEAMGNTSQTGESLLSQTSAPRFESRSRAKASWWPFKR